MKPKPLTKEKIITVNVDSPTIILDPPQYIPHKQTTKWVRMEDVKSAVEWLLKEIEKEIEKKKKEKQEIFSNIQYYGTKVFELKTKPELTPYEKAELVELEGFVRNLKDDHKELNIEICCLENIKHLIKKAFEGVSND